MTKYIHLGAIARAMSKEAVFSPHCPTWPRSPMTMLTDKRTKAPSDGRGSGIPPRHGNIGEYDDPETVLTDADDPVGASTL